MATSQASGLGVDSDFGAQIEAASALAGSGSEDDRVCLRALLSMPVSYFYAGFASKSCGQLADIIASKYSWVAENDSLTADPWTTYSATDICDFTPITVNNWGDTGNLADFSGWGPPESRLS